MMFDKFFLLLQLNGDDIYGTETSEACIDYLSEQDWLEVSNSSSDILE